MQPAAAATNDDGSVRAPTHARRSVHVHRGVRTRARVVYNANCCCEKWARDDLEEVPARCGTGVVRGDRDASSANGRFEWGVFARV